MELRLTTVHDVAEFGLIEESWKKLPICRINMKMNIIKNIIMGKIMMMMMIIIIKETTRKEDFLVTCLILTRYLSLIWSSRRVSFFFIYYLLFLNVPQLRI